MGSARIPGPICQIGRWLGVDAGTLCRQPSPTPGPLGRESARDAAISTGVPDSVQMVDVCLPNLLYIRFVDAHFQGPRKAGTVIDEIVIHDTRSVQPKFEKGVKYLAHPLDGREVSIHYMIGRDHGEIVAMVPEKRRAN